MKVAAQADFYFEQYGIEKGLKCLEELGYQYLVYSITGRYDQPFATEWTDKELEEHYALIWKAIENSNMEMFFAILPTDIYLDDLHHTAEARKKMCVQAVKAAAYAGCKILGVRPAILVQSTPDAKEKSKKISCEIFDMMQATANEVGVQLAFINGTNLQGFSYGNYCYGSNISELLELAQKYNAKIIIDPVNAYLAHEKVEELIIGAGDKLIGVLLTDIEGAGRRPVIPTTGCVNYVDVSEKLKYAHSDAALVAMYTPVYKRYRDFVNKEGLITAIGQLLRKIVCVFAQKADNANGREKA